MQLPSTAGISQQGGGAVVVGQLQTFPAVKSSSPGVSQQTLCTRLIVTGLLTVAQSHLAFTQILQLGLNSRKL